MTPTPTRIWAAMLAPAQPSQASEVRETVVKHLDELIAHIVAIGPEKPELKGTDREHAIPMARRVWREVFADLILAALPVQASDVEPVAGPWVAHVGEDYAVVMLPDETTDSASIQVFSEDEDLPQRIADALNASPVSPDLEAENARAVIPADEAEMWAEGIVTDGERVAFAQKAETDHGDWYWATDDGGDGSIQWEPTHFIARAALEGSDQ